MSDTQYNWTRFVEWCDTQEIPPADRDIYWECWKDAQNDLRERGAAFPWLLEQSATA